jgi:F-type H+-transporting ATPase subunit b
MKRILTDILSKRFLLQSFLPAVLFLLMTGAIVYASGGGEAEGHGTKKLIDFGWKSLNVIILLAILYKLTAKGIKGFFVGRRATIKESLEEAIEQKEAAQKKFEEYSAKLEEAKGEIEDITQMIHAQGLAEKEKIIEDARRAADKMKEDTKSRMDQEFKKMRNELRAEATELSVQMAEAILKKSIKKNDHDGMVKDFIDGMVKRN